MAEAAETVRITSPKNRLAQTRLNRSAESDGPEIDPSRRSSRPASVVEDNRSSFSMVGKSGPGIGSESGPVRSLSSHGLYDDSGSAGRRCGRGVLVKKDELCARLKLSST